MIAEQSFAEEWIKASLEKQGISPDKNKFSFAEKMNHALLLAEVLKINGLDFVFKGGTSLILLLDIPQRFSIDLDIITKSSPAEIENVLEKSCQNSRFTHFEIDEREITSIPKIHYHVFFKPKFANSPNDNKIVLDVIFGENPYPKTQEFTLAKEWIATTEPLIKINIPTIESIMGDKLTAFAPNTTGVRYGMGKHSEIIKQMFDLGQLFDAVEDFEMVAISFYKNVETELSYRQLEKTPDEVLGDIWQTCVDVIHCFDEKQRDNPNTEELWRGIKAFSAWTIRPFRKENAFEIAGKIAYVVARIQYQDYSPLRKFDDKTMKILDFLITETSYNLLNKKVKYANYALFYWNQAISTIRKN